MKSATMVKSGKSVPLPVIGKIHHFPANEEKQVRERLLVWYNGNKRVLPWRTIAATESNRNVRAYAGVFQFIYFHILLCIYIVKVTFFSFSDYKYCSSFSPFCFLLSMIVNSYVETTRNRSPFHLLTNLPSLQGF